MAQRVPGTTIDADQDTLVALRDLEGYMAVNPAYTIEALTARQDALLRATEATLRARKALLAARDAEAEAAAIFHSDILGAKAAVVAQFGASSPQVQAIGLKKKSDRRRPARRAAVVES